MSTSIHKRCCSLCSSLSDWQPWRTKIQYKKQKWMEGCEWGGGTALDVSPPQPSHRKSSWWSSRGRHSPAEPIFPWGLAFRSWQRHCQAEPESASSPLLGYTRRLVQLGEKLVQVFRNHTRFWLKRLGLELCFSVLHISFDVFAWKPG